ncbi:hypothetical protein BCR37DRAFT_386770 [Protomyces lactucae-debilis]|uniref:Uncharacterized protein n=1 Tax=Protomyces lactucae-debilis TaxID=2754530 RepID=A0A1Y2FK55_PROLT|nr:uncharacterized protein BCR37DRAFT_386770 [Protomyces lactucae-debilis]ORY83754.1 hypothetical protein BCR37DRAFT_386770 [Protomyces lactucae-debilis]
MVRPFASLGLCDEPQQDTAGRMLLSRWPSLFATALLMARTGPASTGRGNASPAFPGSGVKACQGLVLNYTSIVRGQKLFSVKYVPQPDEPVNEDYCNAWCRDKVVDTWFEGGSWRLLKVPPHKVKPEACLAGDWMCIDSPASQAYFAVDRIGSFVIDITCYCTVGLVLERVHKENQFHKVKSEDPSGGWRDLWINVSCQPEELGQRIAVNGWQLKDARSTGDADCYHEYGIDDCWCDDTGLDTCERFDTDLYFIGNKYQGDEIRTRDRPSIKAPSIITPRDEIRPIQDLDFVTGWDDLWTRPTIPHELETEQEEWDALRIWQKHPDEIEDAVAAAAVEQNDGDGQ